MKRTKRLILGLMVVCVACVMCGCRAYRGYCIYEETVPLRTENEKVVSEEYRIVLENEKFSVYKIQRTAFDQYYKIDEVESWIYKETRVGEVIANFIVYPLILAFSPFIVLGTRGTEHAAFDRIYYYGYWRQLGNTLNPFIYALGDDELQQENEILSSREIMESKTGTNRTRLSAGEKLILRWDDQEKEVPVSISLRDISKIIFTDFFPAQRKKFTVAYKDQLFSHEIDSTSYLTAAEKRQAEAKYREEQEKKEAERLAAERRAKEEALKAKLAALEKIKYPYASEKMPGIKLYRDVFSGLSQKWVHEYRQLTGKDPFAEYRNVSFDFMKISDENSVLCSATVSVPAHTVTLNDIVEKYKKEYPGIQVTVKDTREQEYDQMARLLIQRDPRYYSYSLEQMKNELKKGLAQYDFRVFTLQNETVKIEIKLSIPLFDSYSVTITDVKYSALGEKQRAESKRQRVEKALDF